MGKLSQPITVLLARLTAATATGKLLAGYKLAICPAEDQAGVKDLPAIVVYEVSISEQVEGNSFATPGEVYLSVSTRRTLGLASHIEACEKLWDTLDCDTSGVQELTLDGSIMAPLIHSQLDFNASQNSLTTYFKAEFQPVRTAKGERHL